MTVKTMKNLAPFGLALAGILLAAASVNLAHAAGDASAGEAVFKKNCMVCHTTEAGKNKLGPSLHGVVGRHSASISDYSYSDAMKKADKTWDPATLDTYLTNPRGLVPGTKMIFVGLKNEQDRENVIAYLESQK
ncbi:MAG TPA: cytochrome c family protein [Stellaceae bacterium]|nr:cytochrome c family protein [Stellaceae bacterium]